MTDEPSKKVDESVDDELEARIADIEERAKKLKGGSRMPEPPEWNYERPARTRTDARPGSLQGAAWGMGLVYALISPIIAGWGIGWLLDNRWSLGETGRTWGAVVGMIAGLAMVVIMVSRANADDGNDEK